MLEVGAMARRKAVRASGAPKSWGCQMLKESVLNLEGTVGEGTEEEGVVPECRGREGEAIECSSC